MNIGGISTTIERNGKARVWGPNPGKVTGYEIVTANGAFGKDSRRVTYNNRPKPMRGKGKNEGREESAIVSRKPSGSAVQMISEC